MIRRQFASLFPITALLVMGSLLGGCASAVVGAGAAVGVAAYQERGVAGAAKDQKIGFEIREKWLRHDHRFPLIMSIEVYEGRVLLTGVVDDPNIRADAVRLTWTANGVKEVINEIQIADGAGIVDMARDSWVTAKLKGILTFDEAIMAINYSVETVNGTVYLIGIAQNQAEVDRVVAHARAIEYVRKVISHVRVKNPS
jgi:osmotically-inducible protein OsmY